MVLFLLKNKKLFSLYSIKVEYSCCLLLTNMHNTQEGNFETRNGGKVF